MFYFRVKGTESLISAYHVIRYKSHRAKMQEERRMKGGGAGMVVVQWRWCWCINLHGVCREGNSYAEEQEAHVASKLPGNWYSLV